MNCNECRKQRLNVLKYKYLKACQRMNGTVTNPEYQDLPPMVRGAAEDVGLRITELYQSLERLSFAVMDANPDCKQRMVRQLYELGIDHDFCVLAPDKKAISLAKRIGLDYRRWLERAWMPLLLILQVGGFMVDKCEPEEMVTTSVDWR